MTKIGWSTFALNRNKPGKGYSYFEGSDEELFRRIDEGWENRKMGAGGADLTQVCLVPVNPQGFHTASVFIEHARDIETVAEQRRAGEDYFVKTLCDGPEIPCRYVDIVLYSRSELMKDSLADPNASYPYDWEIVSINASDVEDEPMHPLAMARNQLYKPGGNRREYSSSEWARAVWFWRNRVSLRPISCYPQRG